MTKDSMISQQVCYRISHKNSPLQSADKIEHSVRLHLRPQHFQWALW